MRISFTHKGKYLAVFCLHKLAVSNGYSFARVDFDACSGVKIAVNEPGLVTGKNIVLRERDVY